MLGEDAEEVVGVLSSDVFDAEVIDDEDKLHGAPGMAPETRSRGSLVVPRRIESFAEEVVGEFA